MKNIIVRCVKGLDGLTDETINNFLFYYCADVIILSKIKMNGVLIKH